MTPEYPGYGLLATFRPSTRGIDTVALAAWNHATNRKVGLGYSPSQVVLCGRSIGTGPAVALAADLSAFPNGRQPGGVILFAPYTNLRDLCATQVPLAKILMPPVWDTEANLKASGDLPLLIIHGEDDEIIPVRQGRALYDCAQTIRKAGFFPKKLGHCQWNSAASMRVIQRWLRTYLQDAPQKFMSEALPEMPQHEALEPDVVDPADFDLLDRGSYPLPTPRAVHGVLNFIQNLENVHAGRRPRGARTKSGIISSSREQLRFPPYDGNEHLQPPAGLPQARKDFCASEMQSQMHPKGVGSSLRDSGRAFSAPASRRGTSQTIQRGGLRNPVTHQPHPQSRVSGIVGDVVMGASEFSQARHPEPVVMPVPLGEKYAVSPHSSSSSVAMGEAMDV